MNKRRRRRVSVVILVIVAVVGGSIGGFAAFAGRPEVVSKFQATAVWDAQGQASVHERIDYVFPLERHGIYRELPGVPWNATDQVKVTADHTDVYDVQPDVSALSRRMADRGVDSMTVTQDQMVGVRVKIGDPNQTVSGRHRYDISYPLLGSDLGDGRIGWDGVGASWDVPINAVKLQMVAPWNWEHPTCDAGSSGSVGGCRVVQTEPGRLEITHGRLESGEGITVYAQRGTSLDAAPAPLAMTGSSVETPLWQRPLGIAVGIALAMVISGLVTARLVRRAGRDWVMAGPASTDSATDLAFAAPMGGDIPIGARRVDDAKLADWATTEFAPPRGLSSWQGGVLAVEATRLPHRVAWLFQAVADGYVDMESRGAGSVELRRVEHAPDETSALLEVAFGQREKIRLGSYDPKFAAMWTSVGAMQQRWLDSSIYVDHRAKSRVAPTVAIGIVVAIAATIAGVAAAGVSSTFGAPAAITAIVTGLIGGAGFMAAMRCWELNVRTPAGSAMWLRVESFRKFLEASESQHVREAAERGVLREYTAWAVALGESDHWNAMVQAAGLPPQTAGVSSSMMASHLASACVSASTAPSSSSGGGSSGGGGGGGGVGGGGGGGGGGSW